MSLIHCPECGHEISQNAVACPNCGMPTKKPTVVVEKRPLPPPVVNTVRREGIPPWAIALMSVLGLLLVVVLFFLIRSSNDSSNANVVVNANLRRQTELNRNASSDSQSVTVPGSQVSVPESGTTTTVPGTSGDVPNVPLPDKGTVIMKAKLIDRRGGTLPARAAKFYLLDKDLETILNEARVEPIEGNSLSASIGLASVYPDRYRDFQREAMRAIAAHSKYSGTTDGSGAAKIGSIAPDQYYLFAIVRVGNGFALWNSPVSVIAGDNTLDLAPQSITEIASDTSGE